MFQIIIHSVYFKVYCHGSIISEAHVNCMFLILGNSNKSDCKKNIGEAKSQRIMGGLKLAEGMLCNSCTFDLSNNIKIGWIFTVDAIFIGISV